MRSRAHCATRECRLRATDRTGFPVPRLSGRPVLDLVEIPEKLLAGSLRVAAGPPPDTFLPLLASIPHSTRFLGMGL